MMNRLEWLLAHLSALIIGILIGVAINSAGYKIYDKIHEMMPRPKPVIVDDFQTVGRN